MTEEELANRVENLRLILATLDEVYDVDGRDERRVEAGFVNDKRYSTCPDCLLNGFVSKDCSTCEGRGELELEGRDPYYTGIERGKKDDESTSVKRAISQARLTASIDRIERAWIHPEPAEDRFLVAVREAKGRSPFYANLARALDHMRHEAGELYEELPQGYWALVYLALMPGLGKVPKSLKRAP